MCLKRRNYCKKQIFFQLYKATFQALSELYFFYFLRRKCTRKRKIFFFTLQRKQWEGRPRLIPVTSISFYLLLVKFLYKGKLMSLKSKDHFRVTTKVFDYKLYIGGIQIFHCNYIPYTKVNLPYYFSVVFIFLILSYSWQSKLKCLHSASLFDILPRFTS